jgi:hypothetical protein
MRDSDAVMLAGPHSIGEILRAALGLFGRYPLLFVILALAVIAPYDLTVTAITGFGPLAVKVQESQQTKLLLDLLNFSLIGSLISALHMHAVVLIADHKVPRLSDVAIRGLRALPVVVAAEIIAGLGIGLGFVALLIPGILLSLRWSVVAQTAAVEQEGWLPALRRSGQLTAGHYWHVFGLYFLIGALDFGVLSIAAGAIGSGRGTDAGSLATGIAVRTVVASFSALVFAILYLDLRARSDGQRTQST